MEFSVTVFLNAIFPSLFILPSSILRSVAGDTRIEVVFLSPCANVLSVS